MSEYNYDSLYSDLSFSTKEQIAAIVCSSGPKITLKYANVQVHDVHKYNHVPGT